MTRQSRTSSRTQLALTAEEEQEAEAIVQRIQGAFTDEIRYMARLMASKKTEQLFGKTEFELRDRVHTLGATLLEAAAAERVKKGVPGS